MKQLKYFEVKEVIVSNLYMVQCKYELFNFFYERYRLFNLLSLFYSVLRFKIRTYFVE